MLTFSGKTALVTGGTGDLGQAIIQRLRNSGLQVAFTYHRQEALAGKLEKTYGFLLQNHLPKDLYMFLLIPKF